MKLAISTMSLNTYEARSKYHPTAVGRTILEIMTSKKSNLALSADVTDTESLLALTDGITPAILVETDSNQPLDRTFAF